MFLLRKNEKNKKMRNRITLLILFILIGTQETFEALSQFFLFGYHINIKSIQKYDRQRKVLNSFFFLLY